MSFSKRSSGLGIQKKYRLKTFVHDAWGTGTKIHKMLLSIVCENTRKCTGLSNWADAPCCRC
jgi:hypothetical protein